MALPCSPMKSWTSTRSGSPLGRHTLPLFLYRPTISFFLQSILTTGSPEAAYSAAVSWMWRNWASRSSCWVPSNVLALPCRLYPASCSSRWTSVAETPNPWDPSSTARVRNDFDVHRSGVIGSPRDSGSTRASNASTKPGCSTSARLRPHQGSATGQPPTAAGHPAHHGPDAPYRAKPLQPQQQPPPRCARAHEPPHPAKPDADAHSDATSQGRTDAPGTQQSRS